MLSARSWPCAQAAELTVISEDLARYCMDNKQQMAGLGFVGGRREEFISDLQMVRAIRHAAVHRAHVNKSTVKKYSSCVGRLLGVVQDALNLAPLTISSHQMQVSNHRNGANADGV